MEITVHLRTLYFVEEFSAQYSPDDWAGIIITELKEMNLDYSEEYQMGLFTFGEEVGNNHVYEFARVVNKYMKHMGDMWPIVNYLIMRFNP